jgi:GNAT superfamily N-acetyltransferase
MKLAVIDRKNKEHAEYIRNSLMECYSNDPRAAKRFPDARARHCFMNGENFKEDFSRFIVVDNERCGFFFVGRNAKTEPWELGFLWVEEGRRGQGLGTEALLLIEKEIQKSEVKKLVTVPHSKRSPVNGVPGFNPSVLSFFVKRGYFVKSMAAGAYQLSPWNFNCDFDRIAARNKKNENEGFRIADVKSDDADYDDIRDKAEKLCMREGHAGWTAFFHEEYSKQERECICSVLHGEDAVAVCAYSLEPCSPGIWGWGPQWGPLLADSRFRGKGLAGWVITESLKRQFVHGAKEVTLWTTVDSNNSRMYEKYGFRLSMPWFSLEKEIE